MANTSNMKKLYTLLAAICLSTLVHAQCMVQTVTISATCNGTCDGSAMAYANGVPPFTYLWSPGGQTTQTISGQCAGSYTVTMIDSVGCVATAICTITEPAPLSVAICNLQNPSCQSCCDGFATACATGGTPPYMYYWTPAGQTTVTAQALCVGTQTVCVVDANGCSSCTVVTLSSPTGITESGSAFEMNIDPVNPGGFLVSAAFPMVTSGEIVVTDMLGQIVFTQSFGNTDMLHEQIDLGSNPAGPYFISVITNEGRATQQVIVE